MYEKIVVPLDGSKVGEAALPYVEDLISKLLPEVKVEVTLLQVISPSTHPAVTGVAGINVPYTKEEMEQAKERTIAYLKNVGEARSNNPNSTRKSPT